MKGLCVQVSHMGRGRERGVPVVGALWTGTCLQLPEDADGRAAPQGRIFLGPFYSATFSFQERDSTEAELTLHSSLDDPN